MIASVAVAPPAQAAVAAGDLVFEQHHGDQSDLVLWHSGSAETILTSGAFDQSPEVSSDGTRLVYTSPASGGYAGIRVKNLDGGGTVQITTPDALSSNANLHFYDAYPRWSPDGTKIAFHRYGYQTSSYTQDIYVINSDGAGLQALTTNQPIGNAIQNVAWSPDGQKLAYTKTVGSPTWQYQVWVIGSDGSNPHLVDAGSSCDSSQPEWSPNGSRIYVTRVCSATAYIDYLTSTDSFASAANTSSTTLMTLGSYTGTNLRVTGTGNGTTLYLDKNSKVYTIDISTGTLSSTALVDDTSFAADVAPTPVKTSWPNTNTLQIAAIGDSVTAGEGINYGWEWDGDSWENEGPDTPTWFNTTGALGANYQQCHQSGKSYAHMFMLNGDNYQVLNMACTGATGEELLDGKVVGYTPELDEILAVELGGNCTGCADENELYDNLQPDKVIMTLGANDVDFGGWVAKCYGLLSRDCGNTDDNTLFASQSAAQKNNLREVLREIKRRGEVPNPDHVPDVYVAKYYNPFPTSYPSSSCADLSPTVGSGVNSTEMSWLVNRLADVNDNIEDVTGESEFSTMNIHIVDLSGVMNSHRWCSSDSWVYGPSLRVTWSGGVPSDNENPAPFHPTIDGQRAIYGKFKTCMNGGSCS